MLGELGIDVTTLGNHEYDYKAKGLANMMNNAVASGDTLPAMVICNVDWDSMNSKGLTEEQQMLWEAFEGYGVEEYVVIEKGDVNIAVIGVFGEDALDCVVNPPLEFQDPVEAVKETVAEIKANEDVDMIVCVSHSGTWDDEAKSEDEILAKSVPEIDLIISGHTHSKLPEPIVHGNTYIVSAAEYGKYLGNMTLTQKTDGRWNMDSYDLITVGENIEADKSTQEKVDSLMAMVDSKYLEQFGFTKDQVLAQNKIKFVDSSDTGRLHTELNLGSIMADSYTYALGDITTANVYNSFSLGIGEDGIPGYPLISVYLTGEELKFFMIIGIVAAVIAVLVLIIVLIVKVIKMVVKKIRKHNKR